MWQFGFFFLDFSARNLETLGEDSQTDFALIDETFF
jgi:hypothetical protein